LGLRAQAQDLDHSLPVALLIARQHPFAMIGDKMSCPIMEGQLRGIELMPNIGPGDVKQGTALDLMHRVF
jgi:hypothetical protein